MNNTSKYILFSLTLFGVVFLLSWNKNASYESVPDLARVVVKNPICYPQKQACQVGNEKFKAEIVFDKDIFYLKPFKVTVQTEEKENQFIKAVVVDFKMKSMDMGLNRFALNRKSETGKLVDWQGTALLPVCVTGRIDWFSEIEFVTGKEKYVFSFPMEVKKTSN